MHANILLLQSTFIPTAASVQAIRLLQVSANKRYLAAAELPHASEQQQVSVYNVPAQKREQTLQLASHTRSNTVTALSFRCDQVFLFKRLTMTADHRLLLWTLLVSWQQSGLAWNLANHP